MRHGLVSPTKLPEIGSPSIGMAKNSLPAPRDCNVSDSIPPETATAADSRALEGRSSDPTVTPSKHPTTMYDKIMLVVILVLQLLLVVVLRPRGNNRGRRTRSSTICH